ncbi:hypothetical protein E1263_05360 [Kribbella antibiotica]|uniref:Uncharacterized protein n=1 Tax=Kribbella antibiotica TaxID=190195 RepID=A0A4R4ZU92_9ACTN|nr:hypothetical protein [Kribbella antibiotica]TDD62040.1 hypothetical protein E1263_05360 [Kribbella antibiotica]
MNKNQKRGSKARRPERRISVRAVRREKPDMQKLGRALAELALAQAEAEAEANASGVPPATAEARGAADE